MIAYRLADSGLERIEHGCSTFIDRDPRHPAWAEFRAWQAMGHNPEPAPARPSFEVTHTPPLKNLWIIGAGGYGREVFWLARSSIGIGEEWQVAGFLNDLPDSLDAFPEFPRIHGDTTYVPRPDDLFICAIGDRLARRAVSAKFKARGAAFLNLIQRTACVSPSATLGEGIVIEPFTGIGANCRIGDFTTILGHVIIAHDVTIGAFAQISPFACILGRASIGDEACIASHAVILPEVKVGAGATVGAGSVVIKDVPDGVTVFGVPARQIQ